MPSLFWCLRFGRNDAHRRSFDHLQHTHFTAGLGQTHAVDPSGRWQAGHLSAAPREPAAASTRQVEESEEEAAGSIENTSTQIEALAVPESGFESRLARKAARMTNRFFHGTRAELTRGDLIAPAATAHVFLSLILDEAVWSAELADGDSVPRVYFVEPLGSVERAADQAGYHPPGHLSMSLCSRAPLRVTGEVTEWVHYHGTWGAELAAGEGRGRIYLVEPTGPVEDDPNLTGKKFRGNPTKSFRSREPLRITGEIVNWQGHTPEAIKAMKDGLDRLQQLGLMAIDD